MALSHANVNVYLDGRGGSTYITRAPDGMVSIYKNDQPIFVIE